MCEPSDPLITGPFPSVVERLPARLSLPRVQVAECQVDVRELLNRQAEPVEALPGESGERRYFFFDAPPFVAKGMSSSCTLSR